MTKVFGKLKSKLTTWKGVQHVTLSAVWLLPVIGSEQKEKGVGPHAVPPAVSFLTVFAKHIREATSVYNPAGVFVAVMT